MGNNGCYTKPEYIEKQRAKKLGSLHPKWKGGNSYAYQSRLYKELAITLEQKCSMCSSKKKLVTHHIDHNYKNNVLSNITIVCRGCHNKIHKTKNGKKKQLRLYETRR